MLCSLWLKLSVPSGNISWTALNFYEPLFCCSHAFLCCFCLNSSLHRKLFFNIGFFGIFINFFNIFQDCLFIPVQKYIKINILEIQYELERLSICQQEHQQPSNLDWNISKTGNPLLKISTLMWNN